MYEQLFEEIKDNWKLDAKSENNDRYFYHVEEVKRIIAGKKSYVIGRKGTGKTSISKYISKIKDPQIFSENLSFKNFPFNDLYSLKNSGYTHPNQYITLWKYIIYSNVCKMMARNEAIDPEVGRILEKVFSPNPLRSLISSIKRWVANDFSLNILGSGGKISFKEESQDQSWIDRVEALEQIIANNIDSSSYYIVFDELDEDYKDILNKNQYDNYTHLLTGLLKAVQDIKSTFPMDEDLEDAHRIKIFPVVFLRDDIYSILMDADKTKWDDFKIELDWDKEKIKKLLSFRISRAFDKNSHPAALDFDKQWGLLFDNYDIDFGHRQYKRMSAFDYMARSTHLRPRDFIKYIQACAENVNDNGKKIPASIIKKADKSFSEYLRRELTDEIHSIFPEISGIFDILSQIRKQTFTQNEFEAVLKRKNNEKSVSETDAAYILKVLFLFSVIGNQPRQVNQTVFRYLSRDASPNFSENFVIHRGLLKALQIL